MSDRVDRLRTEDATDERTRLMRDYQPLVLRLARAFCDDRVSYEDLCQSGQVGLLTAIDRYERAGWPVSGCRWSILKAMRDVYADAAGATRIPTNLLTIRGVGPGWWRLPRRAGISVDPRIPRARSLEDWDLVAAATATATATATDDADELRELLSHLAPRERWIIEHRYGLSGRDQLDCRELAARLGISRPAVSLCTARALAKMRAAASR